MTTNPTTIIEAAGLSYLDAKSIRFLRHGATVHLTIENDRSHLNVTILRVFPLSEPHHYLSLRNNKGEEIGLITDPEMLEAASRELVAAELQRRYVVPVIRQIVSVKERFDTIEWHVETDRGACRFTTRNLRDNVVRPSPARYLLTDVDGNRFDIPDFGALPLSSQNALLAHL